PLSVWTGVNGKIKPSISFSGTVVANSLAVEGMELTDHEEILIADEPEDFAWGLIELYESEEMWKRLSENGIRKTRSLYSTAAAREKLEPLFSDQHLTSLGASLRETADRGVSIAAE